MNSRVSILILGVGVLALTACNDNPAVPAANSVVTIESVGRVPVCDANSPHQRTLTVVLSPSPLPEGDSVMLQLRTVSGSGAAVFDDGLTSRTMTQTATVGIRGSANSDQRDNIALDAIYRGRTVSSERFSVRTWPVDMVETNRFATDNGILGFEYSWQSESGSAEALLGQGLLMGEIVSYTGDGDAPDECPSCFRPYSPPYSGDWVANPYIREIPLVDLDMIDEHGPDSWTPFREPYRVNVFIGTQHYRFRDPLLMDQSTYATLLGPFYIRRNVYVDGDVWKFRIEKDGLVSERILGSSGPLWSATTGYYSETDDLDAVVAALYEGKYRVADWNDLVAYSASHSMIAWADSVGMLNGYPSGFLVTWNGNRFWSGRRHYWIDRHDHVVPYNWLVHSTIDNHFIDLGSWYDMSLRILCIRTQ